MAGVGGKLSKEVKAWGTLGIIVVVISIVVNKFMSVVTDASGVGLTTVGSSNLSDVVNDTVGLFVTGFQEPGNWVSIVIIAVVGFALFYYFSKRR